jgi:hypothetical protein
VPGGLADSLKAGTYTVRVFAFDSSENVGTCKATLHVVDKNDDVINLKKIGEIATASQWAVAALADNQKTAVQRQKFLDQVTGAIGMFDGRWQHPIVLGSGVWWSFCFFRSPLILFVRVTKASVTVGRRANPH